MLMVGIMVSALVGVAVADADPERAAPNLRIVSDQPFVVAGSGFRSNERVHLLVAAPGPVSSTVRAGRLGRFRVILAAAAPRCGSIVVQAVGNRGSRAMIDRAGLDCADVG